MVRLVGNLGGGVSDVVERGMRVRPLTRRMVGLASGACGGFPLV